MFRTNAKGEMALLILWGLIQSLSNYKLTSDRMMSQQVAEAHA